MVRRIGLMMENCGHTAIFEGGSRVPVTLLRLYMSVIVSLKTEERHGYNAAVLGVADGSRRLNKPQDMALAGLNLYGKFRVFESRVESVEGLNPGGVISISHFVAGQYVDVTGTSLGKGFAGPMKRHNFKGMRASHGVSLAHRAHGSTGQCQDPGRVFKNKKMAGHMGACRVTVQNLRVMFVDETRSLVVVKGNNVPGFVGSRVFVRDSVKKSLPAAAPFPYGVFVEAEERESGSRTLEE